MADLDDFFAKKDRKKSKTTKKFSTTDEVAKKLEDSAKRTEKLKKERAPEGDETAPPVHEDEWKDFEEEKKDYSGLKIGNLAINSAPGEQQAAEASAEASAEPAAGGEEAERRAGPWRRVDAEPGAEEAPERPEPARPPAAKTAYVAPAKRNQPPPGAPPSRFRSKAAPDIHNEDFFPTLSKTGDARKGRNEGTFEVVQNNRSYRSEQPSASVGGPKISLENRYNTLSDS